MNKLINDKDVSTTAPATPGLLNIYRQRQIVKVLESDKSVVS